MARISRRSFVNRSALAAGSLALTTARGAAAANERVVIGLMGVGGRGNALAHAFARQKDVEIAYLCDCDLRKLVGPAQQVEEIQGKRPATVQDFRRVLEDSRVDAVINATPDHWHALGTILACQAGKHVYVEKPASHNLWEGRKMIEAARKYKRVVQLGTQTRSAPYAQHAVEAIRSGKLGEVHLVKVFNMKTRPPLKPEPDQPTPKELDYDTWLGPAPSRPYNPNHYYGGCWNWKWPYSGGDIINDAVHQIDLARWASLRRAPKSVFSSGDNYCLEDGQDSPDTQMVTLEFEGLTMMILVTLWTPYMKKIPQQIRDSDEFPNWPFCATKVEVYGTDGIMLLGRHGGGWQIFNADSQPAELEYGRDPTDRHIVNFLECVRSGERPNADIEEGHLSTALCHLANISLRVGSRKLEYDAERERFRNDDEANGLVKRTYREAWTIPDEV